MATETETETIQLKPSRAICRRTCHRRHEDERDLIAKLRRQDRKELSDHFREEYFYCKCKDNKTCIWYGGLCRCHSWTAESCGITWAGVHGKSWICVVTKTGDLDLSRVNGYLKLSFADEVFRKFRRAAISELEDLADPKSELRRKLVRKIKPPFGVVSVAALPNKVHKASCEYKETKFMTLMLEGLIKEIEGAPGDESEIDEEFDENDEDAYTKYVVKSTRRSWRNAPENYRHFDVEESIFFIQREMKKEEMKRAAAITKESSGRRVFDEKNAIEFLKKKMKKPVEDFTPEETVKESSGRRVFDEENAIEFLKKKMKKPVEDFTPEETVKTAISAFQRLCNTKFNANEIQVTVMDPDYFILTSEELIKDAYVRHLETVEIDKYLSDMKDQSEECLIIDHHRGKRLKEKRKKAIKAEEIGGSKGTT